MNSFIEANIIPYFQPIISIDNNAIYGYEVLGRYIDENKNVNSLGSFFCDPNTNTGELLRVDRTIREKAIKEFSQFKNENERLFINMRLAWLQDFSSNPEEMPTIKWARITSYNVCYTKLLRTPLG